MKPTDPAFVWQPWAAELTGPRLPLLLSPARALTVVVIYGGTWGYKGWYLNFEKKLEDEFPRCLDICSKGAPQATGYVDMES